MDLTVILAVMPAAALLLLPALRHRKISPRIALRAAINTLSGIAVLFLVNAIGAETCRVPQVGAAELITAGILGIPGVGLLYLLGWML